MRILDLSMDVLVVVEEDVRVSAVVSVAAMRADVPSIHRSGTEEEAEAILLDTCSGDSRDVTIPSEHLSVVQNFDIANADTILAGREEMRAHCPVDHAKISWNRNVPLLVLRGDETFSSGARLRKNLFRASFPTILALYVASFLFRQISLMKLNLLASPSPTPS